MFLKGIHTVGVRSVKMSVQTLQSSRRCSPQKERVLSDGNSIKVNAFITSASQRPNRTKALLTK